MKLRDVGAMTIRTDEFGTIERISDGENILRYSKTDMMVIP